MSSPEPDAADDRDSGMSIEFALSIRYNRKRPETHDRFISFYDPDGIAWELYASATPADN